jgi:hypothetical protein
LAEQYNIECVETKFKMKENKSLYARGKDGFIEVTSFFATVTRNASLGRNQQELDLRFHRKR